MRSLSAVFICLCCTCVVIPSGTALSDDLQSPDALKKRIDQLRADRIAALTEGRKIAAEQYNGGLLDLRPLIGLHTQLFDARLERAKTLPEKIDVAEQQLKVAQKLLQIVFAKEEAGMVTYLDVPCAKSVVADAQVRLQELQHAGSSGRSEELETELMSLRSERCAAMQEALKIVTEEYSGGLTDYNCVLTVQRDLQKAHLALASSPQETLSYLEQYEKIIEGSLDIVQRKHDAGAVWLNDLLTAKAHVLDVKIRIRQLRQRIASKENREAEIRQLQDEQIALLTQLVSEGTQQYYGGLTAVESLMAVHHELLMAKERKRGQDPFLGPFLGTGDL